MQHQVQNEKAIESLPIARYELRFRAEEPYSFRGFTGSAWRGIFGHALKRTVCITRHEHCPECMLYRSCVYPYIFDTPLPVGSEKLRTVQTIPHPFLLEVPWAIPENSEIPIRLTLIGHANRYVVYAIHALEQGACNGVRHSPPLILRQILQEERLGTNVWLPIKNRAGVLTPLPTHQIDLPQMPAKVRIVFETPLRLRCQDRYLTPDRFSFVEFFRNLLGRLSLLKYFHSDEPLTVDFAGLISAASLINFTQMALRWRDWQRYSSRQKQKLQMGGLMGSADLDLTAAVAPFWPYLWIGQFIHAGKGTSMGLGKFRLESLNDAAA